MQNQRETDRQTDKGLPGSIPYIELRLEYRKVCTGGMRSGERLAPGHLRRSQIREDFLNHTKNLAFIVREMRSHRRAVTGGAPWLDLHFRKVTLADIGTWVEGEQDLRQGGWCRIC